MKRGPWKKEKVVAFSRPAPTYKYLAKGVVAPFQEKLENERGL